MEYIVGTGIISIILLTMSYVIPSEHTKLKQLFFFLGLLSLLIIPISFSDISSDCEYLTNSTVTNLTQVTVNMTQTNTSTSYISVCKVPNDTVTYSMILIVTTVFLVGIYYVVLGELFKYLSEVGKR